MNLPTIAGDNLSPAIVGTDIPAVLSVDVDVVSAPECCGSCSVTVLASKVSSGRPTLSMLEEATSWTGGGVSERFGHALSLTAVGVVKGSSD